MGKFANRKNKNAAPAEAVSEAAPVQELLTEEAVNQALDATYGGEPLASVEPEPEVTAESYDGPGYAAPTFTSYTEAAEQAAANAPAVGNPNGAPLDDEAAPALSPIGNGKNHFEKERAKLFSAVGKLGGDDGKGKKSMVALVDVLLDAAEAKLITPGSASGKGEDDAIKLYKRFRKESAEASGKFAPADQDADSLKAQASKLRQIIKVGASGIDGVKDVFDLARNMHIAALGTQDKELLRHGGTYEALVVIAREQLKDDKRGVAMTEDQIRDILFKEEAADAKDKTGLDFIKSAYKAACQARDGKAATDSKAARTPIDHGNLEHAIGHLDAVIRDLDPSYFEKMEAEAQAKLAAFTARKGKK